MVEGSAGSASTIRLKRLSRHRMERQREAEHQLQRDAEEGELEGVKNGRSRRGIREDVDIVLQPDELRAGRPQEIVFVEAVADPLCQRPQADAAT